MILIFLLLTLLTMENILLDIKDLMYGRIYIKNWKAPRILNLLKRTLGKKT